MSIRKTTLAKSLLAAATSTSLMLASHSTLATIPIFSNLNLSSTGLLTGNVKDGGVLKIDEDQPVKIVITVDGDTQNQVSLYSSGGANNQFSVQLNSSYLDGASHSVQIDAFDMHNPNPSTQTSTLTGALTAPSNNAPILSNLSISEHGEITGNVSDSDAPTSDLLVEVSIDGNPANRQKVVQGVAFSLQTPMSYLDGQSHSYEVTVNDANLPGISINQSLNQSVSIDPQNDLPVIEWSISEDGYINGTAYDPDMGENLQDKRNNPLIVMLKVDQGTEPVGIITRSRPEFRLLIPAQYIGDIDQNEEPIVHQFTLYVEDANIPLAFTTETKAAALSADILDSNANRDPVISMGFDIDGSGTLTTYDVDNPIQAPFIHRYFDERNSATAISFGAPEWRGPTLYGSKIFIRQTVDVGFRTAQEQDLYAEQTPRTLNFTIPISRYDDYDRNHPIEIQAHDPVFGARFGMDSAHYPVSSTRSLLVDKIEVLETHGLFNIEKTFAALSSSFGSGMAMSGLDMLEALWQKELEHDENTGLGDCETSVPVRDANGETIQENPTADIPSGAPTTRFHDCRPTHEAKQLDFDAAEIAKLYKPVALVNRIDLVSNRPDLAATTGQFPDCGEFRIIYAREDLDTNGAVDPLRRNLIIFEARLENPTPTTLNGCLGVQKFWQEQVSIQDPVERAHALEDFFFSGISRDGYNYGPVVAAGNFRSVSKGGSNGQIRTNQFMTPRPINDFRQMDLFTAIFEANTTIKPWVLKEFKLTHNPSKPFEQFQVNDSPIGHFFNIGLDYQSLVFDPVQWEIDNNQETLRIPYPANYDEDGGTTWLDFAADFRNEFLQYNNLKCLMQDDLARVANNLAHRGKPYNDSQSYSSPVGFIVGILDGTDDQFNQSNYLLEARKENPDPEVPDTEDTFEEILDTRILELCDGQSGITTEGVNCDLTAKHVLNRATALSCGGCHQPFLHGLTAITDPDSVGPGQSWPDSHGIDGLISLFVHVTSVRDSDDPTRYDISPALRDNFLPGRASILRDYLSTDSSTGIVAAGAYDINAFNLEHGPASYCQ